MMPILQASGVITPGQLGPIRREPEPARTRLTRTMSITGMPSVMHTIRPDAGIDRLEDRIGRERRRHVDHRGVGAGLPGRFRHRIEHRQAEMACVPPLPGVTPPTMRVP